MNSDVADLSGELLHSLFFVTLFLLVMLRMVLGFRIIYRAMRGSGRGFAYLARIYRPGSRPIMSSLGGFAPGSGSMPFTFWFNTQAAFIDEGMYVEYQGVPALIPWKHLRIDSSFIFWTLIEVIPERTLFMFTRPLMKFGVLRRIRQDQRKQRALENS